MLPRQIASLNVIFARRACSNAQFCTKYGSNTNLVAGVLVELGLMVLGKKNRSWAKKTGLFVDKF